MRRKRTCKWPRSGFRTRPEESFLPHLDSVRSEVPSQRFETSINAALDYICSHAIVDAPQVGSSCSISWLSSRSRCGQRTGKRIWRRPQPLGTVLVFIKDLRRRHCLWRMAKAGVFILDLGTTTIRHRALAKDIDRTGPGPVTVFLRQAHIESVVADALEGYAAGQSQPPVQVVIPASSAR